MSDSDKKRAALAALDFIQDGMTVGLGTGSTAAHFIHALGERARYGLDIIGIPTSIASARLAEQAGLRIEEGDESTQIAVAVDGADEIDAHGNLIKGGGGALLREKIVAHAAARFVVIADGSKSVERLGAFPLPIEIDRFAYGLTVRAIREALAEAGHKSVTLTLRPDPEQGVVVTDGGNYIVDAQVGPIADPAALDRVLARVPGVVTTGLFCGMADLILIGEGGGVTRREVGR
jgi:ribose 5-phosphate isomerase A